MPAREFLAHAHLWEDEAFGEIRDQQRLFTNAKQNANSRALRGLDNAAALSARAQYLKAGNELVAAAQVRFDLQRAEQLARVRQAKSEGHAKCDVINEAFWGGKGDG